MRSAWIPLLVLLGSSPGRAGDIADELLSDQGLASFSEDETLLIASGVTSRRELQVQRARLRQALDRVVRQVEKQNLPPGDRVDALLRALHAGPLKRYVPGASDLRRVLATGRYNCLSATALFVLGARDLDLAAKAYAMRGHVLALVFLPEGPRYVETTDPKASPSRTWDQPYFEWMESFVRAADAVKPKIGEMLKQMEQAQLEGREEDAQRKLEAVRAVWDDVFRYARERKERLQESAFEVDHPTLLSLFYWNRALTLVMQGREKQGLRAFALAVSHGSETWSSKALGVRVFELQAILRQHARKHGWRGVIEALNTLIRLTKNPKDLLELRDLRAQAWLNLAGKTIGKQRCDVLGEAARSDPDHPAVKTLVGQAGAWSCTWALPRER